jgi:hypothetical protein
MDNVIRFGQPDCELPTIELLRQRINASNFSYPSNAAAVVFGGYLSARFRLTGIEPHCRPGRN